MAELPSGTVTFLFTDIEGSTARWEGHPEAMRVALARHDVLIRGAIEEHRGHIVKTMGDAFHAAFSRAPDALAAALDAQRRLQAEPWGEVGPLRVRMALHTGVADERDGDYYGPVLNRAARLVAIGHGGQILLSEATTALVRESLPSGVRLVDLGRHRFKDLTEPERVSQVFAPDLPSDFPPPTSLDARPHNLLSHPTDLLGRERELADVRRLFEDGARLVTLSGPGGTGKTRLGLQIAAGLLDNFEHGVFLVDLAPISDPMLVPSTIAQALGVRDIGNRPIAVALKEYMRSRSVLLLLDNFEQVLPSASVVADLLTTCPGLAVLTTSREPLRLRGEQWYAVTPLALPDARQVMTAEVVSRSPAVELFVRRAREIRADFVLTDENAPAIAEVCARLDGLPLAIELAAACVRLLPPQAMARRLERRLPMLIGGPRDLPTRQQTLRGAIDWSHDLLDERERRLFRRLAVFVAGWTLDAAEAVCNVDGDLDAVGGLESLVSKSLVRQEIDARGEPRFEMLETMREYARDQLEANGELEQLRLRHAQYYVALAEEAERRLRGAAQIAWFDRIEAEHDNIRAVLSWTVRGSDERELGLRLAAVLNLFWAFRGYVTEGRAWLSAALAGTPDRTATRARALRGAGQLANFQGDLATSCSRFEESLAIYRELDDQTGMGRALSFLSGAVLDRGDVAEARTLSHAAVMILREHTDLHALTVALNNYAAAAWAEGPAMSLEQAVAYALEEKPSV